MQSGGKISLNPWMGEWQSTGLACFGEMTVELKADSCHCPHPSRQLWDLAQRGPAQHRLKVARRSQPEGRSGVCPAAVVPGRGEDPAEGGLCELYALHGRKLESRPAARVSTLKQV